MEQINDKVHSRNFLTLIFSLIVSLLCISFYPSVYAQGDGVYNVSLNQFTIPKYNEKTNKLEYILSGEKAISVGAFIKMSEVRIEFIGGNGYDIIGVITTPVAFFSQASDLAQGDKPIHYQSLDLEVDGIGFDCNLKTQLLHIRRKVILVLDKETQVTDNTSKNGSNQNKEDDKIKNKKTEDSKLNKPTVEDNISTKTEKQES